MDEKTLQLTLSAYLQLLPELKEVIDLMDGFGGALSIDKKHLDAIPHNQIISWAYFYDNTSFFSGISVHLWSVKEEASEIISEHRFGSDDSVEAFTHPTGDEISARMIELENEVDSTGNPPSEQPLDFQIMLMLLPIFFNIQSIMTHGCSLNNLVNKAKNGDDKAFCQAIQIDRTILYSIPYFSNRLCKLQLSNDPTINKKLATAIKGKIHGEKRKHSLLWLLMACLDEAGCLKIPIKRLMQFCEKHELYGFDEKHSDEGLQKIRNDFRKKQGVQM